MISDLDLLALNVEQEAGGEPDDGKAAVARVVKNRMAKHYSSDGTIRGTILRKDQFSWAYFGFVNGKYSRIADTEAEAEAIAEKRFAAAPASLIQHCRDIGTAMMNGVYHGPDYDKLTDDVVLYLNPAVPGAMESAKAWATAENHVCTIGHHQFYRDLA